MGSQAAQPLGHIGSSGSQDLSPARHSEWRPQRDGYRVESASEGQTDNLGS